MKEDAAYERSADRRLLDLSRRALGVAEQPSSPWRHSGRSPIDLLAEDSVGARPPGALLKVHFVVRPSTDLIAGARVTLAVAVENEGADEARAVVARIGYGSAVRPLPGDAKLDETALDDGAVDDLFGAGLGLGTIPGGERRTIVATALVDAGLDPIILEANVRSADAPIIAAAPVALQRGAARPMPTPHVPPAIATPSFPDPRDAAPLAPEAAAIETPFYELEPEESLVFEAADAALSTAAPLDVPTSPMRQPIPEAASSPVIQAPAAMPIAAPPPEPEEARALVLVRRIDRARLEAIRSMFASAGVGMLAHFLLANLIAAGQSPDESDPFGLARFIDEQTTVLNRLWVAKRLRKPMEVSDSNVALEPLAPLLRERTAPEGSLVVRISGPQRAFVNSAIASGALPFLRARQIALVLQATAVVENGAVVAVPALVEYAKLAQNMMTKYALRAATKTPDEALATVDPVLDGYAKDVLTYLDTIAQ